MGYQLQLGEFVPNAEQKARVSRRAVSLCNRQAAVLISATGARSAACLSPWFIQGWHGTESPLPACTKEDPTVGPLQVPCQLRCPWPQPPEVTSPPWSDTGDTSVCLSAIPSRSEQVTITLQWAQPL